MSVIRKHWKIILCVALIVVAATIAVLCWRYYQNTHIYKEYNGEGRVVGYEESEHGLIVVLEVDGNPYHDSDHAEMYMKFLVDNESQMLSPNMIYAMKNRITGFDVLVSTREFWLPDAMADDDYIYPVFGFILRLEEWALITKEGLIDEADYEAFEADYKVHRRNMETLEWINIG